MSFVSILLLALAVAMDSTAVSLAHGAAARRLSLANYLILMSCLGGFQAAMPLLGYVLGAAIGPWVAAFDHWIIFGLLSTIGGKMLYEGLRTSDPAAANDASFALPVVLGLSLATSIDAFAVGITLPLMNAPIALTIATIGVVTALGSGLGLFFGAKLGNLPGARFDLLGGLALIGLGAKILWQHLAAA